jgi:hypothetical protein
MSSENKEVLAVLGMLQKILEDNIEEKFTGEITITIRLNQGGIRSWLKCIKQQMK